MQLGQVYFGSWPGFPAGGFPMTYGFGLVIDEDPALGQIVHHAGGYPGFGSHMRWHPATGIGVVAVANGTYATPYPLTVKMLAALVRQEKTTPRGSAVAPHGEAAAGSPLADALSRVIDWINGGQPVPTGEGFDPTLASRRVRSAAAWAGTCRPGVYRGGDGASSVTVSLTGEHASMTLTISIDPATGLLYQLDLAGG